jgi:hypothetical protein
MGTSGGRGYKTLFPFTSQNLQYEVIKMGTIPELEISSNIKKSFPLKINNGKERTIKIYSQNPGR